MTIPIIITICALILIAYVFDLTSSKTKIPSVVLLLILGWVVKQVSVFFGIEVPNLTLLLPILGTIGLILIVLEGSLDLEFNKSKMGLIKTSFIVSLFPIIILSIILTFLFQYYTGASIRTSLINALPLSVISSSIAIPSVKSLLPFNKEFVIYESSFSDIIGVVFFDLVLLNDSFGLMPLAEFGFQLLIIIGISFVSTLALSFLLSKIDHHIKFVPIIILVILIYAVSKIYHLPALIFIMLFGLILGNLNELNRYDWIAKLKPHLLNKEITKFRELTTEGAFLIKALFFMLFGFLIQTEEILNTETLMWAVIISALIFAIRAIQLLISKLPLVPLLFVAPRGLITILLFFAILPTDKIALVNKPLIIQVILITALVMMFGLMTNAAKKHYATPIKDDKEET